MPRFVSLLIDRAHQRYLALGLWLATFIIVLLAGTILVGQAVNQWMALEARQMLEPELRLQQSLSSTLGAIRQTVTAEPCSPAFHQQLHEIAFLPDGLNEFLFAQGGVIRCSVTADFAPYDLGIADLVDRTGAAIWYDEPLDFLGRTGLTGTIMVHGGFGIVVPPLPDPVLATDLMQFELVNVAPSGAYWHRAGDRGIYGPVRASPSWVAYLPLQRGAYGTITCLPQGRICIATRVPLAGLASAALPMLLAALLLCAFLALGISSQVHALLRRFWGFEARFRRHFTPQSILCTYQPILSVATGRISGCEVLVRWRDIDGATIYPDQFLPVVEKFGLGRQLTEYVVIRAFEELSARIPHDYRLQVNFNIFPRDLDAAWLRETLQPFAALKERFEVVIEIVETDLLQTEHAQCEIDALQRAGYRTHLDDFGTGYSSIENLARLPIDGVKLDRSFAMAADGSLMARMLVNAIDMIHGAGHRLTVEGVETEDRLQMLIATGQVDFIQGYFLSRPVDIASFVQVLADQSLPAPLQPALVAAQ